MTDSAAIAATGLSKRYGKHPVLNQLNLSIASGAALGLLGANGAGKTTLLKSLLGLIPTEEGSCTILGDPSRSLSVQARGRIGYVPQASALFPWLTGEAMLRYVAAFYPNFAGDYAHELAERWKIALRSLIGTLSPGQQQRLSLVRALSSQPDVLILDEPIASLDPATRIAVIDELVRMRERRSLTLIFSSHLIGDLERLCSKFAILVDGKVSVMNEVAWFRGLKRVRLQGDEETLEALELPPVTLVRRPHVGARVVVATPSQTESLRAALPPGVQMAVDEPDVEALASEWMQ